METRIKKLQKLLDDDTAVFISSYPNIFYYSNFTSEDAFLLISTNNVYIITDSRYTLQAKQQSPEFELVNISIGFEKIFNNIPQNNIWFEEKHLSVGQYLSLKGKITDKVFIPMSDRISNARRYKDTNEIEKIQQAEQLGDAAFSHILKFIKPGISENQIAAELEYYMKKNGALKTSFDTIVASGIRSAMPHGVASDKIIRNGELLTLDFGCVLEGYCSDMTRTVAVGKINTELQNIYNITLKAQHNALKNMKIGMKCSNIDSLARDIITNAGYANNFGHSLGHSLGIEIHENPRFSSKSEDVLENGNVITVEPGIYIENVGGVRIEDVIAVYDNKIINLTASTKELIIL